MEMKIVGVNMPGRVCVDPRPDFLGYDNIHVALQQGDVVTELVAGDAREAKWSLNVDTVEKDGGIDVRGPHVRGKRGDRYIYLSWGTVDTKGRFEMFRRAKLMFDAVGNDLLASAQRPGYQLVGTVNMTDEKGMPRCAAVRPPAIMWSVEPGP